MSVPRCPECGSIPPTFRPGISCGCGDYSPRAEDEPETEIEAPPDPEPPAKRKSQHYSFYELGGCGGNWWVKAKSFKDARPIYARQMRTVWDDQRITLVSGPVETLPPRTPYLVRTKGGIMSRHY